MTTDIATTCGIKVRIPEGTSGPWAVKKFTVPEFDVESLRLALHGRSVSPGRYTKLTHNGAAIMSDTDAELRDLIPLVNAVNLWEPTRVLINGLGLGVALLCILPHPCIKWVDIVEQSDDVIDLVRPHLPKKYRSRIAIHLDDAYTKQWAKDDQWDIVWHDIWDAIPNDDDKPDIQRLKRKYAKRCLWQGVWAEKEHKRVTRFHHQTIRKIHKAAGLDKAIKGLAAMRKAAEVNGIKL